MSHSASAAKERFGFSYFILVIIQMLAMVSFYMINPMLTGHLAGLGLSLTFASSITGLLSITALCVRPFTGILADRLLPRRILSFSLPLLGISMAMFALTDMVPLLILARILNGIAFSVNGTVITVYASMYVPRSRMGEGIGYLGLGQIIASAVGPTLGVTIGEQWGNAFVFWLACLMALVAFALLFPLREPPLAQTAAGPRSGNAPRGFRLGDIVAVRLLPLTFLNGLFSGANGIVTAFLVLSCAERGIAQCSLYFSVLAIFLFLLRPIAGKLNDRFGLPCILIPAYICAGTGMLIIAHAPNLYVLFGAAALMAFGQGGGQPAIQAQCIKELGPEQRGLATSTYFIFADIFQGAGPALGGFIAERVGYTATYTITSAILWGGLILYLLLLLRSKLHAKRNAAA